MRKHIVAVLLLMLFTASFVAITPFAEAAGEQPDYNWMQKVDKDLLKTMSNREEILGDINGDGAVDVFDMSIVGTAYGSFQDMPDYNPEADINMDGIVDARDLATVTLHYGTSSQDRLLSTIVLAEGNMKGVEDLIVSNGGTVTLTLESIDAVSADIPKNKIKTIAESELVKKIWLDHQIELNPRYDQMNSKAEFLESLLESSVKQALSEEFKNEEFKPDTSRFALERYTFPEGGMMAIEEKGITFQSIEFGDVSPETYFTYQVGAEELWGLGYFGQDTYIAVLDVGINALHPMVAPAIVGGHSDVPSEPNWDSNSAIHGTMTASMAVGRPVLALVPETSSLGMAFARWFPDKVIPGEIYGYPGYIGIAFIGEAPMANLWVEKVLSFAGSGDLSWILAGMEHAIWLRENTGVHIDVITMSIGLGMPWSAINDGTDPWSLMVDEVVAHGITVVQSAGNEGPGAFTVGQGACSEENIAVGGYVYARMMKFYYDAQYGMGASDYYLHMPDDDEMVFYFASRGPTRDYRYQPAVVAPCAFTIGAGDYSDMYWGSGTSFAAPRVAGEALLLVNYYKGVIRSYPTPERIRAAIAVGADYIDGYEKIDQGGGRWNPEKAAMEILESDVIGRANNLLDADEFHSQRMQTLTFEGGVAEVSTGPIEIEHYARFYVKLEDPDMYRITVTDIVEEYAGENTLYIWVTDPKSDLMNIAYAYYSTYYGRIYQYSQMGRYYWSVGTTSDSGAYGYDQYWTPLDPGYYEICVENDFESLEAVSFTLRIEKSEVGMSASADSVTLKNKGVDIDLVTRGGLYAYEGYITETTGNIEQDEWVQDSFSVPDDATELIVTLDWVDDYTQQYPTDLDLYLIDPYGTLWVASDPPFTPMGIFGGTVSIPETDYFGDYTAGDIVPGIWIVLIHGYHMYPTVSTETFSLKVEVRTREVTRPTILYDAPQVDFFWETIEIPTIIVDGDDSYGTYTLPFDFPYYDGNTYDTIYACTNGYITLDSGLSSYDPASYFLDRPMIAPMGEDLVTTVYAIDHGSYVTILWYGRPYGMYPEHNLMLAQLCDNGDIVFSYADWVSPDYWGRDAVAGLSKGDGSTYITISPGDETAFLFEYSAASTTIPIIENYTASTTSHVTVPHGTYLFSGDDSYTSYTLPFDFPYFESTYNTIYICTNGYVTLDSGLSSYNPASYFLDRPMIAPMGEDLVTTVYVTANPSWVRIQWYGYPYGLGGGDRDLMMLDIYPDGRILMTYYDWVSPDYWGRDAVAGVSKGDGSTCVTISPSDGSAFLFDPIWGTAEVLDVDYTVSSTDYFFEAVTPPILSGDDAYAEYTLPFDFWFYGETYDSVYLGTNGYITFTEGHTEYSGLEGLFLSTPMIAPQARDLVSMVFAIDHGTYVTFLWYGRPFGEYPYVMRELMMAQLYSDGTVYISIKERITDAVVGISAGDGVSYVRVYPPHDEKSYRFALAEIIPPAVEFSDAHPWLPAPVPPASRYELTIGYTENIRGRYIFVAKHDWVEKFLRDGGLSASVFGRFVYEVAESNH